MGKYELVKAEHKEFSRYYTIYQLGKYNVWFPSTIQNSIELYYKYFKQDAFWVYFNGKRVGGVLLEPNWFGLVFYIPPFHDEYSFMNGIVEHVIKISDPKKPIFAFGVVPNSVKWLQLFGFQIVETEKDMICATKPNKISFPDDVYVDVPKEEDLKEMIDLYYNVFSKSKLQSLATKPHEFYEDLLNGQKEDLHPEYSTILRDTKTDEIVGSCTVQIWYGLPHILDILVKPSHQRRGLAEMMIKKVLDVAYHHHYPAICLSVVSGNSVEYLYHKLGFLSGVPSSQLKLEL